MKCPIHGWRTLQFRRWPIPALWLVVSTQLLIGCAFLKDPAYEAGWRYGRVLQIGGVNAAFPSAALDCRDPSASDQAYALVKLGASGALSRRTTIGPTTLSHVIVRVVSGAAIQLNDIVHVNIVQCEKDLVRVS